MEKNLKNKTVVHIPLICILNSFHWARAYSNALPIMIAIKSFTFLKSLIRNKQNGILKKSGLVYSGAVRPVRQSPRAQSPAFIIIHSVVLFKIKFKHILSVYNGQAA